MNRSLSYIEISKENLLHNLAVFREKLAYGREIVAVVKANAYGHGLNEVVTIVEGQVDYFQVDDIEELRALRKVSSTPCLVLGYVLIEELEELVQLKGTIAVFELKQIEKLNKIGKQRNEIIKVHLEVDAFLGRLGITTDKVEQFLNDIKIFNNVSVVALYAHFSDIEDSKNLDHAEHQYKALRDIAEKSNMPYHIAATSGMLADVHNHWQGFIVRLGIGLYGLWPSEHLKKQWQDSITLKPVLAWKTHIAQVKMLPEQYPVGYGRSFITTKPTKIAIIPQGYSDGYDRIFSNNGSVLIQGKHCPIIGRIAMNMFMVDVTSLENVSFEEEAVLLGKQNESIISAEDLAGTKTINYEIVARISPLLPRRVC